MGGSEALRKQVMIDAAEELLDQQLLRGEEEGILEPQDVAGVFVLAASMLIVRMHRVNEDLASHVASGCLTSLVKNAAANNIRIGEL